MHGASRPGARRGAILVAAALGTGSVVAVGQTNVRAAAPPVVGTSTPTSPGTPPAPTPEAAPAAPARCVGDAAIARAARYADARPGRVTFAIHERGRVRSHGGGVPFRSASIVKAMVLVADLRRHARLGAPLTGADRARLAAMIRRSDNAAATATFGRVGRAAVVDVARRVGMRGYSVGGWWGTSRVTASDQARFFGRMGRVLPPRYRAYARSLLRSIVPEQTWGGARVARAHGWRTLFKSGWLPQPGGWVVHQGLRLERGSCTVAIAVLTGGQPSMGTGVESIRGVVERLV